MDFFFRYDAFFFGGNGKRSVYSNLLLYRPLFIHRTTHLLAHSFIYPFIHLFIKVLNISFTIWRSFVVSILTVQHTQTYHSAIHYLSIIPLAYQKVQVPNRLRTWPSVTPYLPFREIKIPSAKPTPGSHNQPLNFLPDKPLKPINLSSPPPIKHLDSQTVKTYPLTTPIHQATQSAIQSGFRSASQPADQSPAQSLTESGRNRMKNGGWECVFSPWPPDWSPCPALSFSPSNHALSESTTSSFCLALLLCLV